MSHRTLLLARQRLALSASASTPAPHALSRFSTSATTTQASLRNPTGPSPSSSRILLRSVRTTRTAAPPRRAFSSAGPARSNTGEQTWTRSNVKQSFQTNPFSFTLAIGCIAAALGLIGYSYHVYQSYIIDEFAAYPDDVSKQLRRAMYYANIASPPEPEKANVYFKKALEKCQELNMDPYSDEVIGIKLAVADMLEKAKDIPATIEVLEHVRKDLAHWVEANGPSHFEDGHRTRILSRAVSVSFKLGELYSWMTDSQAAYNSTLWAVSIIVGERRRRDQDGVREGEGDWLSAEEVGASVEALAQVFQQMDKPHLAVHLYLEALNHCPKDSCHAAVIMSNLGVSIMEQNPHIVKQLLDKTAPGKDAEPIPVGEQARKWFEVALRYSTLDLPALVPSAAAVLPQSVVAPGSAHPVPKPAQTAECDQACLGAILGLAELSEREKKYSTAKQFYSLGIKVANAIGEKAPLEQLTKSVERIDRLSESGSA